MDLNPTVSAEAILQASGVTSFDIAITLGSGWAGSAADLGETIVELDGSDIPGFGTAKVAGHSGTIRCVGTHSGKKALVFGTRTHLYEGKGAGPTVHAVRTAAASGARIMVLTNGAGGIKRSWRPGQPVLISDHINLTGATPLEGPNFIDLTDLYSSRLRTLAKTLEPSLDEGVYVQFRGPQYETPAEIKMAKTLGGQIVGMSTGLEAIAAREAGMEVLALSLITNFAAGISLEALNHDEVISAGKVAQTKTTKLLGKIVNEL